MIKYILLLFPILCIGQSQSENYIKSITYKQEVTTAATNPPAYIGDVTVVYYDGLGRPIQKIDGRQTAAGNDLVTHIEYDQFGRQAKDYLPYATTTPSLNFVANAKSNTESFYNSPAYGNTLNPFVAKELEQSPLGRLKTVAAPGNDWSMASSHTVKTEYKNNTDQDAVRNYAATSTWDASKGLYTTALLYSEGITYYPANRLFKTITKDENWVSGKGHTSEEFKDNLGRVLLRRSYAEAQENGVSVPELIHDTYYVYDQFGNLSYVVPPLASGSLVQAVLDGLCYQYRYDSRNRLVEKKLPGKQWEYIVYDKLDRVVATGPCFNPFGGTDEGWLLNKYDFMDRTAIAGWYPASGITSASRKALQDTYGGAVENLVRASSTVDGVAINYLPGSLPTGFILLTAKYYDNYSFLNPSLFPLPTPTSELDYINTAGTITPVNLPTGSWTRVLKKSGSTDGETSYILYDKKLRPIRVYKSNHLGGYTYTDSKLSFTGMTLYSTTHHRLRATGNELLIREDFLYDDQQRQIKHIHKINNNPSELLSFNKYSERGMLDYKRIGGQDLTGVTALQKIDYTYNVRGWLTGINNVNSLVEAGEPNDLFATKINYNTVQNFLNYTGTPLYNGNISETYWISASDNVLRKYGYKYDELDRLRQAVYQKPNLSVPVTNSYNESVSYDKNGNICSMLRNGYFDGNEGEVYNIDDLNYTYSTGTNELSQVDDQSNSLDGFKDLFTNGDYKYDDNGNLRMDMNKGIVSIIYNHLNLPTKIDFGSSRTINYTYNAEGTKVTKTIDDSGTKTITSYQGGFQYLKEETLQFFPTAEGYVNAIKDNYNYVYNYTDHVGNIRLSFLKDPSKPKISILEENNFYPFGLKHANYNSQKYQLAESSDGHSILLEPTPRNVYQYKYQGQERQDELGLEWDSFKWRNYDYAIGRFLSIDPLADKYAYQSPYNFSENRVVDSRELEGLEKVNVTKDNPHLVIVALGRAGGMYGDKIQNGNTLYKNLPNGYNKGDDGLGLLANSSLKSNSIVITYAGSDSGVTAIDIAGTIAGYRENNPTGTVTLIGHSLGGKDVLDAANMVNKNNAIKNKTIDLIMTLEAASVDGHGSAYSIPVSANVSNIVNFNSAESSMTGGGGTTTNSSQNAINITLPSGTNHTNMDNTLTPFIPSMLKRMYNGGNPTNYNNASFSKAKIYNNGDLNPNAGGTSSY